MHLLLQHAARYFDEVVWPEAHAQSALLPLVDASRVQWVRTKRVEDPGAWAAETAGTVAAGIKSELKWEGLL